MPARVVTAPAVLTKRTRWLKVSATTARPPPTMSMATAVGLLKEAAVPCPSAKAALPLPARVLATPASVSSLRRLLFLSAMQRIPESWVVGDVMRQIKSSCCANTIGKKRSAAPSKGAGEARGGNGTNKMPNVLCHIHHVIDAAEASGPFKSRKSPCAISGCSHPTARQRADIPKAGRLRGQPRHCAGSGRGAGHGGRAPACAVRPNGALRARSSARGGREGAGGAGQCRCGRAARTEKPRSAAGWAGAGGARRAARAWGCAAGAAAGRKS